ncbi:MAG: ATP-binding cassette domain-containing protein [Chlamydiae bacterium]|nr:ATP-binding cassette domain-containing protein [Chlamydiota bacterium]
MIHVDALVKNFTSTSFFRSKTSFSAIKAVSFSIQRGEKVAFIGPNGAGKSTTIKMLCGILYPTSGSIKVLGMTPWKERKALGYQIGTVFGQRTQLWYHLPPIETFDLLQKIYEIESKKYKKQLDTLIETFEIQSILHKKVRQLSLGERMRCEIVASLLHRPQILFLDEPTIGLDINAKLTIRRLLYQLSKEYGTTLFLTSHDTADIEQVCDRVIVLDQGSIILDSSLRELKKNYIKKKIIHLITEGQWVCFEHVGVKIVDRGEHHIKIEVNLHQTDIDTVIYHALKITGLKDITIEDPSMEEIIRTVYAG